jgi:hypothetical protein
MKGRDKINKMVLMQLHQNKMITMFCIFFLLGLGKSHAAANDRDIPYEDNDSSYVIVKKQIGDDRDFNVLEKVNLKQIAVQSCTDVPLNFEHCQEAICYEVAPYGKIYKKITRDKQENTCQYIERTPGFGGRDCLFTTKEASNFSNFIARYYAYTLTPNQQSNTDEITQVSDFLAKKCKVITDADLTSVVTIDTPIDKQPIGIEMQFPPEEKVHNKGIAAKQIQAAKTDGKKSEANNEKEKSDLSLPNITAENNSSSAMLTKNELIKIDNIIKNFGKDRQSTIGLLTSGGAGLYLNSILYHDSKKWAIWLNGTKYDREAAINSEITITGVTKDNVNLIWNIAGFEKRYPNWKSKLNLINENSYTNNDNSIQVDIANEDAGIIKFKLKPNQTFNLNTMSIVEGK